MFDFIAKPFGWLLNTIYQFLGSYGIAIIIFTILSKLVLLPFQMKSKKSMIGMQRIQPKMKELEKKYKGDKERYAVAVQQLYKEEGVSMMGGCLPLLLTLPIMFALYSVIREPLTYMLSKPAAEINALIEQLGVQMSASPQIEVARQTNLIDFSFLGIEGFFANQPSFSRIDIYWAIPILSGLTSYLVSWMAKKSQPTPANGQNNTGMMTMLMPIMSVWIAFIVPAGLGFYWIINNLISAIQEPVLTWYYTKKQPAKQGGKQ